MTSIEGIINHRHRERGYGPEKATVVKTFNGGYFDQLDTTLSLLGESIDDVVSKDYHKRIANGEIINNPCLYERNQRRAALGSYISSKGPDTYFASGGSVTEYQSYISGINHITDVGNVKSWDELISNAKSYAVAQIDSTPYAFGEDAGEVRETLRFLRHPFSSLLKLGKSFERDVVRASKRKLKSKRQLIIADIRSRKFRSDNLAYKPGIRRANAIAEVWAEYQFAAAPLVRSALDALEAATFYRDAKPPKRETARGFAESTTEIVDEAQKYWSAGVYDVFKRRRQLVRECHTGILYQVSNPVQDTKWLLGLRLKDVPETTWQLMPYSFMLDRFINVSRITRGVTNLLDPTVRILAGWVVTKDADTRELTYVDQVRNDGWNTVVSGDLLQDDFFTYRRDTWAPSLSDVVPPITPVGLIEDASKTADLISLTYQQWYNSLTR